MSELELPIVDRDRGIIVERLNIDSYSVGTGWYVNLIPDKEDKSYGRWRQADDLTKWCDSECVQIPEEELADDVGEEELLRILEHTLLENGESICKECGRRVPVGSLVGPGCPAYCQACYGECSECGCDEWDEVQKSHSALEARKQACAECGNLRTVQIATG